MQKFIQLSPFHVFVHNHLFGILETVSNDRNDIRVPKLGNNINLDRASASETVLTNFPGGQWLGKADNQQNVWDGAGGSSPYCETDPL